MSSAHRRRLLAASVVTVVPLATVISAAPAQAGTMSFFKSSGRVATVSWEDFDATEEGFDSSFGSLYVEDLGKGEANVFGYIVEESCTTAEEEWECVVRELDVNGGDVTVDLDKRLRSAALEGTLNVFDFWTGEEDTIDVDVSWTAVGGTYTETQSYKYRDGSSMAMGKMRFTGREAEVNGTVGDVDLSEVDGAWGQLGSYREMHKSKTR